MLHDLWVLNTFARITILHEIPKNLIYEDLNQKINKRVCTFLKSSKVPTSNITGRVLAMAVVTIQGPLGTLVLWGPLPRTYIQEVERKYL